MGGLACGASMGLDAPHRDHNAHAACRQRGEARAACLQVRGRQAGHVGVALAQKEVVAGEVDRQVARVEAAEAMGASKWQGEG